MHVGGNLGPGPALQGEQVGPSSAIKFARSAMTVTVRAESHLKYDPTIQHVYHTTSSPYYRLSGSQVDNKINIVISFY